MPHIIVGTAGHIDHGKTALVKAITGIDADRLKEEKERGITIDLGFANLDLEEGTTIGFVDVPGHERFIKNMLAGVGGIDLVMLVIAADESVMPQTREHLDICSLLRIRHGFTVLTKIDNVESEMADLVEEEVRDFVKGSFLEKSPVLRVSSITGEGIAGLVETLRDFMEKIQPRDANQIFRLPIDRCFTMKGFGTVVTGTLISGRIRKDEEVEIFPTRQPARVRGIQVHSHAATEAVAGQRTALNLQGVEVADVQRGMVLTIPGTFRPTSMLDCYLELLPSAPNSIVARKRVRFHIGTSELMGYVTLIGKAKIEPAQHSLVQVRLEEPTFALPGDRFIIRQYSPMITIGGGEVLDAFPEKHRRARKGIVERLRFLKAGTPEDHLMLLIEEAGLQAVEETRLVERLGLSPQVVREKFTALVKSGRIRKISDNPAALIATAAFDDAANRTVTEVKRFHQANPLVHGISREELKSRAMESASLTVFQAVLDHLMSEKKLTAAQELIAEVGRKIILQADEAKMRDRIVLRFGSAGLQVPSPEELFSELKIDGTTARKIVQLLLKEGVLVKVSEDLLLHQETMNKLIDSVRQFKTQKSRLGVSEFKDLTGVSRKYAIPLLEYLDRQRITRRVGDERLIL
jgi:selenocysteine-specific elongation factor